MFAASDPHSGSVMAKAAIASPAATLGSHSRFCSTVPNRLIAPEPEALHGEGEIDQPVMASECLAGEREAAHVGAVLRVAHAEFEESRLAELGDGRAARHPRPPRRIVDRRLAPLLELRRQLAMALVEERPGEEARVAHQSPWNSGVRLLANAS